MPRSSRTFRIFVSSTFSDMMEERSALQERVFPRLADLAWKHDCRFQAIDLRWGVSEEAGLDQQTMPICLEEINRCQQVSPRPNFIVLLGDRYGWRPLPESIPAEEFDRLQTAEPFKSAHLLQTLNEWYFLDENAVPPEYILQPRRSGTPFVERTTWEKQVEWPLVAALAQAASTTISGNAQLKYTQSATGREINEGVFSIPDAGEHVFGYFRSITNRNDILASAKARTYFDCPEGVFNNELFLKQQALKFHVNQSLPGNIFEMKTTWQDNGLTSNHIGSLPDKLADCLSLNESGSPPENLCEAVWLDLSRVMLAEIAKMDEPGSPEHEQLIHHSYGRRVSVTFTGREQELAEILTYCSTPQTAPLIVWGEAGVGKSAVLAEITSRLEHANGKEAVIVSRFIGATAASSTAPSLLESLYRQICHAYLVDQKDIILDYPALVQEFIHILGQSSAEHPLFLILDGLDQLSGPDPAVKTAGLIWLPVRLPPHTHLVASIAPGEGLQIIRSRLAQDDAILKEAAGQSKFLELGMLKVAEGSQLLDRWLEAARRRLTPPQRQAVLEAFAPIGSPQFLRLAFEEARRWKSYQPCPKLPQDTARLTFKMLDWLSLPENHGPELVAHTLEYLAAARYGLAEDELLAVLSQDAEVMEELQRQAKYFPDIHAVPVAVWVRLLADLQPYLFECGSAGLVLLRWRGPVLPAALDRRQSRTRLVAFFDRQPPNRRQVEELPWLVEKLEGWPALVNLLRNEIFFTLAWRHSRFDIRAYWRTLETRTGYSMAQAYTPILEHPGENPDLAWQVAELFLESGKLHLAPLLLAHLVKRWRQLLDPLRLAATLQKMANMLFQKGDLIQSLKLYAEVESIGKRLNSPDISQAACGGQAAVLRAHGQPDLARPLLLRQEALCRQGHNLPGLQASLGALAQMEMDQGELGIALIHLAEQEQLCDLLGDWDGLQAAWGSQARIYRRQGNRALALDMFEKQRQLCVQTGNLNGQTGALNNLSLLYQDVEDYPRAFALLNQAEQICQETQSPQILISIWINQSGMLAFHFDRPAEGLKKAAQASRLAAQLGFTNLETKAHKLIEMITHISSVLPPSVGH